MPKNRKLTYSDHQSRAASNKKLAAKKLPPTKKEVSPASADPGKEAPRG